MGRPVASPPAWGPRIHLPAPLTAGFADRAGRPPVPEVRGPQAGRAAAREGLRGKLPHLRRAQRERPLPQCLGRVGSGAPRCRPALFWSPRLHRGPLTGTRSPWGQAWLQVPTALCPRAGQRCSGGGGPSSPGRGRERGPWCPQGARGRWLWAGCEAGVLPTGQAGRLCARALPRLVPEGKAAWPGCPKDTVVLGSALRSEPDPASCCRSGCGCGCGG